MFCFNVFAYLYYPKPLWKWRKIHHIRNRRPANSKKGQHDWTSCRDSGVLQKAVILLPSTGIKKIPHGNLRESLHIEGYAYLLWSSAAVGARKNSAVPLRLHLRINKMVHRCQRAYKNYLNVHSQMKVNKLYWYSGPRTSVRNLPVFWQAKQAANIMHHWTIQ